MTPKPKLAMLRRDHVHQKLKDARTFLAAIKRECTTDVAGISRDEALALIATVAMMATDGLKETAPLVELDRPRDLADPARVFEQPKITPDWRKL